MNRRDFLGGVAVAGLSGWRAQDQNSGASSPAGLRRTPQTHAGPARIDRIFRVTVCLRPSARPDLGSMWSVSAIRPLCTTTARRQRLVAVVGIEQYRRRESDGGRAAGGRRHRLRALGLTSAILLQRAGAKGYDLCQGASAGGPIARATRSWTPDSRIALTNSVTPDFPALWRRMCRTSFHTYESFLGIAGIP